MAQRSVREKVAGARPLQNEAIQLPEFVADHAPISRIIHRELRAAILSGTLPPGRLLRQQELARRFCASRAPLREALNTLAAEGLVVMRPRRGFAVTSLDPDELLEIFELRAVIEEHAGFVATQARQEQHVAALRKCLNEMEISPLVGPDDAQVQRWSAFNLDFHDTLEAASGRTYLCQMARNLRAKLEPYIRLEARMTKGLREAQREHRQIVAAFAAGNASRVAQLVRTHCEHTARRLFGALAARGIVPNINGRSMKQRRIGAAEVRETRTSNSAKSVVRGAKMGDGNGSRQAP